MLWARRGAALPLPMREVYRLSAVEGLDPAAVAARLGIGVGEVECLLAEAILALGARLAGDG